MYNYVILAESQLVGGHTEYYVLCGLGVPSLRSLWGAVRNRQLQYIAHVLPKLHFFQFFNFFLIIYTTYRKKKLHALTAKKDSKFFYNSHDLPQKHTHTHIYHKKVLHD